LRARDSEHWMVERIKVFCADVELDALGQIKTPAQRKVRLVERVRTAQPVPGEVSRLPHGR
jgi:hypothetical protein